MASNTTVARQQHAAPRNYMLVGLLVLVAAGFLRFWQIAVRPGFEWDEPVYNQIGRNEALHGLLQTKTEAVASPEPYLYHPPFYFKLLGWWDWLFGAGITQARVLAATGSMATLILLWLFLRRLIGNWALLAVALIAFDGWMVFSNRISWIENTMVPLGVAALWLYYRALQSQNIWAFALAGLALGATATYKHLGIYFLMAAVIHWIVIRRFGVGHVVMLATSVVTMAAYVTWMLLYFGPVYWNETGVQVLRSLGSEQSRGSIISTTQVLSALGAQYKIFISTLVLAAIGVALLVYRTVKLYKQRHAIRLGANYGQTLLYSWAMASVVLVVVSQIKLPQYFMLVIYPMYCFIASEAKQYTEAHQRAYNFGYANRRHIVVAAALAVLMAGGVTSSLLRLYGVSDHALADVAAWTTKNLPADAIVITEESVGTVIPQQYCKMWRGDTCTGAAYIIKYTSRTQQPPTDNHIMDMINSSTPVYMTRGYKETITVLKLLRPVAGK